MKKRVIWKMFALEIITLGIYRLYWLIKTRKEMMDSDAEIKILHPLILISPVFLVIAAVVPFVISMVSSASKIPKYCSTYSSSSSLPTECQANPEIWTIILLYAGIFLIFPIVLVWLWGYAKGVEKITKEKMSFPVALLIMYAVPDGIDILLVQDAFNKVSQSPAAAPAAPIPPLQ